MLESNMLTSNLSVEEYQLHKKIVYSLRDNNRLIEENRELTRRLLGYEDKYCMMFHHESDTQAFRQTWSLSIANLHPFVY